MSVSKGGKRSHTPGGVVKGGTPSTRVSTEPRCVRQGGGQALQEEGRASGKSWNHEKMRFLWIKETACDLSKARLWRAVIQEVLKCSVGHTPCQRTWAPSGCFGDVEEGQSREVMWAGLHFRNILFSGEDRMGRSTEQEPEQEAVFGQTPWLRPVRWWTTTGTPRTETVECVMGCSG